MLFASVVLVLCTALASASDPTQASVPTENDTLLVGIRSAPSTAAFKAQFEHVTPDTIVWRFDPAQTSPELMQRQLEAQPWVRVVEPNLPLRLQMMRREPANVWAERDLRDSQPYLRKLAGLLQGTGGGAVPSRPRIAVVDTGVDITHPDLAGNIGDGINMLYDAECDAACTADQNNPSAMDYNGHGTAIAGLIGARHNDIGIDGLNDSVELLPVKAFDREGRGSLAHVLRGLLWAREHKAHIVNLSFGTPVYSRLLAEAIADLLRDGILVVAAAGNQGAGDVLYPARFANVIAVGSSNAKGISSFSNVGEAVTAYAPGEGLMTTQTSALGPNVYAPVSGTSAAAAYMTGLLSQVMATRRTANETRAYLRAHTLPLRRNDQDAPTVNAPLLLADLQRAPVRLITAMAWDVPAFVHPTSVLRTRVTLMNSGNTPLPRLPLQLLVQRGDVLERIDAGVLPALAPGKSIERKVEFPVSDALLQSDGTRREDLLLRLEWAEEASPRARDAQARVQLDVPQASCTVTADALPSLRVERMWINMAAPKQPATVAVQVRNDGNVALPTQTLQAFARAATHEGVFHVEPTALSRTTTLAALAPGAVTILRMPLVAQLPEESRFSIEVTLSHGADGQGHAALQSFEQSLTGELMPQYSGDAHVASVAVAVELLRMLGHELPDVHADDAPFAGTPESTRDFGMPGNLGARRRGWRWKEDWPNYPVQSKTLLDGARACDAVDVAYGDHAAAVWDTHFWLVDENDHMGLGEHSALDKIMVIMLGEPNTLIEDGAIAAYKQGDKARAWWLVGHAAHLIGDLSTSAHTLNRNWHGVVGDAFHDWLGHNGRWQGWTAGHALSRGGMVDVYDPILGLQDTAARLRYLAYSTAQVGQAFPWRRTRAYLPAKGPREGPGNVDLGGDAPHYEASLEPLMQSLPKHPRTIRDVELDEVVGADNACVEATGVSRSQQRADCWDGGDDHICMSNTTGGGNDADGDMSRIADASYVYALRSITGLLYLFARETGQL